MRISSVAIAVTVLIGIGGCSQEDSPVASKPSTSGPASATSAKDGPQPSQQTAAAPGTPEKAPKAESRYVPPTAEELAPLRPEYAAELAKVDEPPEMANKPMQVRKSAPPDMANLESTLAAVNSPEKATHAQREAAINAMLESTKNTELVDNEGRAKLYVAVATLACFDESDPATVIAYANNAGGDENDYALALRARMYLKAGKLCQRKS